MKPYGFVYKLTYLPTKKIYVGRHKLNGRKNYLGSGSEIKEIQSRDKKRLPSHWRKLWKRQVIDLAYSFEELREKEYDWIQKMDALNPLIGYNILEVERIGGVCWPSEDPRVREKIRISHLGDKNPIHKHIFTKEERELMRRRKLGTKLSKEAILKISKARKGIVLSDDTKTKLSLANLGENNPNYGKRGEETSMFGKHHTEETKTKMSQRMSGKNNPMYGVTSPNKGKKMSEEQKRKISESRKRGIYEKKTKNNF